MVDFKNYIGGEFIASSQTFANINPANGAIIGNIPEAGKELVDRAVLAAKATLSGGWGCTTIDQRARFMHRIADGIQRRFEEFVAAEVTDTGRLVTQARQLDVARGIQNFRFFADQMRTAGTECFEMETADGLGALNYSVRKPLGVVGVIAPWNLPLLLLTWKVAPALAAGNAVLAKPSEETPGTASLLAEVIHEVGLPSGAFNLLHGSGSESTGSFITEHPGVDAITFTGESATGSAIMRSAAGNVKHLSFELGGKNALIVFADSDIEAAIDGAIQSVFKNCGQVCLCTERIFVEAQIFEEFVDAMTKRARRLRIGWPHDDATEMGPMISISHRDKVLSYYELARQEGANVLAGGNIPEFGDDRDNGAYIQPTVLTGLPQTSRINREEIFGPVCHVSSFTDEEEAISLANDCDYGLAATIWTTNLQRAHRVARQIEAGTVWVNSWFLRDLRAPFGGVKLSGVGREGGAHSLAFYSEPTNICIKF